MKRTKLSFHTEIIISNSVNVLTIHFVPYLMVETSFPGKHVLSWVIPNS